LGNRFDDPDGLYRVLYASAQPLGCYLETLARFLEEAPGHFGWLAAFAGQDLPALSALTQKRLGWQPTGPGLIADLEQMHYFETENSTAPARAAR
jgi:hypothetical protein